MRLRPLVPIGDGMAHRVEEVVRATVSDELEALLQVGGQLLVVRYRPQVRAKALFAFEIQDDARVVDHGSDLWSAADHPRVLCHTVDLAIAHARDALELEAMESGLDPDPLGVHDLPADAGLEDTLAELLQVIVGALGPDSRRRFHRAGESTAIVA
jgi:hypothetical protein